MNRRELFQRVAGVTAALTVATPAQAMPLFQTPPVIEPAGVLSWSMAITYRRYLREDCDVVPAVFHSPWRPVNTPMVVRGSQLLGHPGQGNILWYTYQIADAVGQVLFTSSSLNERLLGVFDADYTFTIMPPKLIVE